MVICTLLEFTSPTWPEHEASLHFLLVETTTQKSSVNAVSIRA